METKENKMESRLEKFIDSQVYRKGDQLCFHDGNQAFAMARNDRSASLPLVYEKTISDTNCTNEIEVEAKIIEVTFSGDVCHARYNFRVVASTPLN